MKGIVALSIAALTLGTSVALANPAHHGQPARPAASAETVRPGGMGMMGAAGPMMGRHVEGSLAFLKTELEITRRQESAWNSFADAYRDFAASKPAMMMQGGGMMSGGMMGGGMMGGGSGSAATDDGPMQQSGSAMMSYPDRMKTHMQMMQEHFEAGKKFQPAVEALYDVLGAEQRKTADELLPMFTMMGGMM
jgi:hypothetical protein